VRRARSASLATLVATALTVFSVTSATPAVAAKKQPTITVLVTNDDGLSAPADRFADSASSSAGTRAAPSV